MSSKTKDLAYCHEYYFALASETSLHHLYYSILLNHLQLLEVYFFNLLKSFNYKSLDIYSKMIYYKNT